MKYLRQEKTGRLAPAFLFLTLISFVLLLIAERYEKRYEKEAFWDKMAESWEEISNQDAQELTRIGEIVPLFGLREGETVLDAGCGTGRLIPFLLKEVGRSGCVCGLDFSREMIQRARKRHYDGDVSFIKAGITKMPLPSEGMDRIICFGTFAHIDNKAGALMEFLRVLRPSGVLVICNLLDSQEMNELLREIGGAVARDRSPDAQEMERLFIENGFTPLELLDSQSLYLMKARKPVRP